VDGIDNAVDALHDAVKSADSIDNAVDIAKQSGKWEKVNESMSDAARAYQTQITGVTGQAWIQNGVKFDGIKDGVLIEAKGHYSQFIDKSSGEFYDWFSSAAELQKKAIRQIIASEGLPIKWLFSEEDSLRAVEKLFGSAEIEGIEMVFAPIN
jgi:hypothetical protein